MSDDRPAMSYDWIDHRFDRANEARTKDGYIIQSTGDFTGFECKETGPTTMDCVRVRKEWYDTDPPSYRRITEDEHATRQKHATLVTMPATRTPAEAPQQPRTPAEFKAACKGAHNITEGGWPCPKDHELEAKLAAVLDANKKPAIRTFETGATRNIDVDRYDYEAFLSPRVLRAYGAYMHAHRKQADGTLRDGDNWQKGIPMPQYQKSLIRHVFEFWEWTRRGDSTEKLIEAACAIMFNIMGWMHERLKAEELTQGPKL